MYSEAHCVEVSPRDYAWHSTFEGFACKREGRHVGAACPLENRAMMEIATTPESQDKNLKDRIASVSSVAAGTRHSFASTLPILFRWILPKPLDPATALDGQAGGEDSPGLVKLLSRDRHTRRKPCLR